MARDLYVGTLVLTGTGGNSVALAPNLPFTVWTDPIAGTNVTAQLVQPDGSTAYTAATDTNGNIPNFRGPDGYEGDLHVDTGIPGNRYLLESPTLKDRLVAFKNAGGSGPGGAVTSVNTYTGAVTIGKQDVGLGNVDNTSDAQKPVSSAQATAIGAKANDNAVVHTSGAETVNGVKTFTASPSVPAPVNPSDAANRKFVLDNAGSSGGSSASNGKVDASAAPYGMSTTGTAAANGAALQQATIDAAGREVVAKAGDYPLSGCALTDQHVNWNLPGVYFLQPLGTDPCVVIERTPGTPRPAGPTYLTWWGPWQPSGVTVSGLLQAIPLPSGGFVNYKGGRVYRIDSKDAYPWSWSALNLYNVGDTPDYSQTDGLMWQAETFPLLGIGLLVSNVGTNNSGPLESMMVQGSTSGAQGLVQSRLLGNASGGITASQAHITFTSVTGDFVNGENLVRIAGGNPTYPSTNIAAVGAVVGTVTGAPVLLTADIFPLQYGRTTAGQAGTNTPNRTDNTVQLREVDTKPICRIRGLGLDVVGSREDPDAYQAAANRTDVVQLRGVYMPEVQWRVRNAWTRAMCVWSDYMGVFEGSVDQMPNHAILTQQAFAYGIEYKAGSKGGLIKLRGHTVRHLFTTNPNQRTYSAANNYNSGKWSQWDYGTPIRTTVDGFVVEAAFAPAMDTHPGDYYTTFMNGRIYGGGSGGRYNTDNNSAFSTRGFGTKYKNVECDASVVGVLVGGVEHDAGLTHRYILENVQVHGALAQCVLAPPAMVPGQATIEIVGGEFTHRLNYPKDGAGTSEPTNTKYGIQASVQVGNGVNLEVRGDAMMRRFGATPIRSVGTGSVDVYSAIFDYTEVPSASGIRMEPGSGVSTTARLYVVKIKGTAPTVMRNQNGNTAWSYGLILGNYTNLSTTTAGTPTYTAMAGTLGSGGGGSAGHPTGVAPTVAAGTNASGATVTFTSGSTDVSGEVNVAMSTTAGTANGPVAVVTFGTAFGADTFPVVSGVLNSLTRAPGVWQHSASSFAIGSGNALAASTTYKFTYYVPGI